MLRSKENLTNTKKEKKKIVKSAEKAIRFEENLFQREQKDLNKKPRSLTAHERKESEESLKSQILGLLKKINNEK